MLNKAKNHILEFALYGKEPLHLLFLSLEMNKVCLNVREAIPLIMDLARDGYLEVYYHSGMAGDKYREVRHLGEDELQKFTDRIEPHGFKEYPEDGEYFVKTTDAGARLITEE